MNHKIGLLAVVLGLIGSVHSYSDSIPVTVKFDSVSVARASDNWLDVNLSGYELNAEPARPVLPRKVLVYALPPDADPASVRINIADSSVRQMALPGGQVRPGAAMRPSDGSPVVSYGLAKSVANGLDTGVYGQNAFYPAAHVQLLGVSRMRDWQLARIAVNPALYNPLASLLQTAASVTFSIEYQRKPVPAALSREGTLDATALKMVANPEAAAGWYSRPVRTLASSAGDVFTVLTTDAILAQSTNLFGLLSHKRAKGFVVHVVTETTVNGNAAATGWNETTGQYPNEKADRIRQWLKANYQALRIRYVLLVGDPTPDTGDLPMKMCWPNFASTYYREAPTDYYYADLTGNWDLDGDGYYGEEGADAGLNGVDFTPELFVGRIPVYPGADWAATLAGIVQKTIRYENSTSTAWRKNALLPLSFLDDNTDEGVLGEYVKSDILQPAGWSAYTLYEQGTCSASRDSRFSSNEELLHRSTVEHWKNNAYGFTFWMGHGWEHGAVCCSGSIFESSHAAELNNQFPGVVFMGSCTCGHPETHDNVAYSVLKNGAIAGLGATRVSWYAGTWIPAYSHPDIAGVGYHIFNYAVRSNLTFSEALYTTMATMNGGASGGWWMNRMDFNLYGDPSLSFASAGKDTDGDTMADDWETANGFNPEDASDAGTDADGDGLSNAQEYTRGTNPRLSDTDLDSLGDATDSMPTTPAYAQAVLSPELTGYLSGSISSSGGNWYAGLAQWGVDRWNRYAGVARFNLAGLPDAANIKGVVLCYAGNGPGWGYNTKFVGLDALDPVTSPAAAHDFITAHAGQQVAGPEFPRDYAGRATFIFNNAVAANLGQRLAADRWTLGLGYVHQGNTSLVALTNLSIVVNYEVPRSYHANLTVAGTFNGWNQNLKNMRLVADYTWQAEVNLTNAAGVRFKFVADANWAINWGEQNQSDFALPVDGSAELGNYGDITVGGTLNGTYRFTFNEQTGAYRLEFVPPPDRDADGMPDAWETQYGLNPDDASDASGNLDGDGYTNLEEFQRGTDPRAYNAPRSSFSSMTAAGTFNGWNQNLKNMRLVADYTWQAEVNLANATGVRFKFVADTNWAINWGEQNQSDFALPVEGTAERGNSDILVNGTLNGTYRITFNEQTGAYRLEFVPPPDTDGDGLPDAWETQYSLDPHSALDATQDPDIDGFTNLQEYRNGTHPRVWDAMKSAYSSLSVPGSYNNWDMQAYKMRLVDHYTWQIDFTFFSSGTIELKLAANGSWGVNWGDRDQPSTTVPAAGYAERDAANIKLAGPFSGYYRLTFHEQTGAYSFGLKP